MLSRFSMLASALMKILMVQKLRFERYRSICAAAARFAVWGVTVFSWTRDATEKVLQDEGKLKNEESESVAA